MQTNLAAMRFMHSAIPACPALRLQYRAGQRDLRWLADRRVHGLSAATAARARQPGSLRASWRRFSRYCVGCHNDRAKIAGVSFQGITAESIGAACRPVREGRAQDARARDAAARRAAARRRGHRLAGRLPRRLAGQSGQQGARSRPGRAAPAQSQGIHERGSRSPGGRVRCRATCCRRTTSPRASTTSRRHCRCRRPSSSST